MEARRNFQADPFSDSFNNFFRITEQVIHGVNHAIGFLILMFFNKTLVLVSVALQKR